MTRAAPTIVRNPADLRDALGGVRVKGEPIALIPTMGALHEGHLSLIRIARQRASWVVASLFVNPRQFAAGEDLDSYPRDEPGDLDVLAQAGCDLVYAPDAATMYPHGFSTRIEVEGLTRPLEGVVRPGHFSGVATVVAKLLIQVAPQVAVFGEKDFQQLQVIRRLARDLDLPVEIIAGPTVRAPDGLALSSRNARLSVAERVIAPRLYLALNAAADRLSRGEPVRGVEEDAKAALALAGFAGVDYFETWSTDLQVRRGPGPLVGDGRVLAAARLGSARLIDNLAVTRPRSHAGA